MQKLIQGGNHINDDKMKIREGDLYDIIIVDEKVFEIRYGFHEEFERHSGEPFPIFPHLDKNAEYTKDGYRIITQMQDPCEDFEFKTKDFSERVCGGCIYFGDNNKLIDICKNERQKTEEAKKV